MMHSFGRCLPAFAVLAPLAAALLPTGAAAHKLNILAWPSGKEICGEVRSGDGDPEDGRNVKVVVRHAERRIVLAETVAGARGEFCFALPEQAGGKLPDLLLVADAGSGHLGEQLLSAAEYSAAAASTLAPSGAAVGAFGEQQLRQIVADELNRELLPIRRSLAELQEHRPDFRDILGGIGWIFGLAGAWAWLRGRTGGKQGRRADAAKGGSAPD